MRMCVEFNKNILFRVCCKPVDLPIDVFDCFLNVWSRPPPQTQLHILGPHAIKTPLIAFKIAVLMRMGVEFNKKILFRGCYTPVELPSGVLGRVWKRVSHHPHPLKINFLFNFSRSRATQSLKICVSDPVYMYNRLSELSGGPQRFSLVFTC